MEAALFIGVVVALMVVAGVFGHFTAKKRRAALTAFAQQHGLTFSESRRSDIEDAYPFGCFRRGSKRYGFNLLSGEWRDRPMLAMDYHYETTSRDGKGKKSTHTHYFSAVIVTSGAPLKPLVIRPEGLFDKAAAFFGFEDIDFESAEFSRKFHVSSPDRKWAYDVLHARAIQHLLDRPAFTIEFDRRYVLLWKQKRFSPEEFAAAADVGNELLTMLPAYVVRAAAEGVR